MDPHTSGYLSYIIAALKSVHKNLIVLDIKLEPKPSLTIYDATHSFDAGPLEELIDLSLRQLRTEKKTIRSVSREVNSAMDYYEESKNENGMLLAQKCPYNVLDAICFESFEIPVPYDSDFDWHDVRTIPKFQLVPSFAMYGSNIEPVFELCLLQTHSIKLSRKSVSSRLNEWLGIYPFDVQSQILHLIRSEWLNHSIQNKFNIWSFPQTYIDGNLKRIGLPQNIKKILSFIQQEHDAGQRSLLYHKLLFMQINQTNRLASCQDYIPQNQERFESNERLDSIATRTQLIESKALGRADLEPFLTFYTLLNRALSNFGKLIFKYPSNLNTDIRNLIDGLDLTVEKAKKNSTKTGLVFEIDFEVKKGCSRVLFASLEYSLFSIDKLGRSLLSEVIYLNRINHLIN